MTEIQFLAQFLLEPYLTEEMKRKIVERIVAVEDSKPVLTAPAPVYTYIYPCQHTYPQFWGGTTAPRCTKCGEQQAGYGVTYGGTITVTAGDSIAAIGSGGSNNTAYVSADGTNNVFTLKSSNG